MSHNTASPHETPVTVILDSDDAVSIAEVALFAVLNHPEIDHVTRCNTLFALRVLHGAVCKKPDCPLTEKIEALCFTASLAALISMGPEEEGEAAPIPKGAN